MMIGAVWLFASIISEWIPSSVESFPYPRLAQLASIRGDVELKVALASDGTPKQVIIVSGPKVLRDAAAEAVRKWSFVDTCQPFSTPPTFVDVKVQFRLTGLTFETPRQSFVYVYPRTLVVSSETPHWSQ